MTVEYNLVELFSGIGSQAKALKNLGVKLNVIKTCEWDYHAFMAYDAIHMSNENIDFVESMTKIDLLEHLRKYKISNDGKKPLKYDSLKTYSVETLKRMYSAILRNNNAVDISSLRGKDFNEPIDILTYSFPCQDLSNVGAFHGYNKGIDKGSGSRSSLLWEVGKLLNQMKRNKQKLPRFLILENVPALLAERHKTNFEIWKKDLVSLGYHNKVYLLNAVNYGIPQNRPRLIMISTLLPKDKLSRHNANLVLNTYYAEHDISEEKYYSTIPQIPLKDLLRIDYDNQIFFEEAKECQPNDTESRRKIWDDNPKIIDEFGKMHYSMVRTLTTKQDRNPNSGNLYFDYDGNTKSKFRYLTPRECFLFMGFTDIDFENVIKNNPQIHKGTYVFARDKLIRMAGNSIPVKMLEHIFNQVIEIDKQFASTWIDEI